jgi:hypothetical protein
VLQRIWGASFIVGAILLLVSNVLFLRIDDPSDIPEVLAKLADNETFSLITFLGLTIGLWAVMIGVVGVYRSISSGGAATWARLGFYGIIAGTTFATVGNAVGMTQVGAAADWIAAGSRTDTATYSIAASLNAVSTFTFYMFVIAFWLALVFLGIGMVSSGVYPKWLGWPPVVLGGITVVVAGFPLALSDPSQTLDITFGVLAGLTTLWALVLGVWISRKA